MGQPKMSLSARGAAALAAALTLSAPTVAQAQQQRQPQPQSTEDGPVVGGLYETSNGAGRYATPDGAVRFVFDRTLGPIALLRFDGDPEVHVLRPTMAAGGGEIYRTDDGRIMLRVTPQGGITVYTRTMRTGAPATELERVRPLAPEAIAVGAMEDRFRRMQNQAQRNVGQTITFTIPARMSAQVAGLVVDAAERVLEGLAAAPMTNVRRVIIVLGPAPAAQLRGDVLLVQVAPNMGYAGRPSSNTIRNVVTGAVAGPQQ